MVRRASEFASAGNFNKKENESEDTKIPDIKWNVGDIEYEAYMRMLDAAVSFLSNSIFIAESNARTLYLQGYRTGYPYRLPSYRRPAKND